MRILDAIRAALSKKKPLRPVLRDGDLPMFTGELEPDEQGRVFLSEDEIRSYVATRAFQTGGAVIANVADDGSVSFKELAE